MPLRRAFISWALFFTYSCAVAFLVQLVLLPWIFPKWHAGNGLLVAGDWVDFHAVAIEMYQKVRAEGWGAWLLRPGGRTAIESGVASAIYVLTNVSQPWVLIPLQAFLHATGALLLLAYLLTLVQGRWKLGMLAVLPFLMLPSNLVWVAMIHKDGASILSALFFLHGWRHFFCAAREPREHFARHLGLAVLCLSGAWGCLYLVRAYLTSFYLVMTYSFALVLLVLCFVYSKRRVLGAGHAIILLCVTLAVLLTSRKLGIALAYSRLSYPTSAVKAVSLEQVLAVKNEKQKARAQLQPAGPGASTEMRAMIAAPWIETPFVPRWVESKLYLLSDVRNGYLGDKLATDLDPEIRHGSALDMALYLPRALSILFFAPFPKTWVGKAKLESNTAFRKIAGMEMLLFYLLFPAFLTALCFFRKSLEMWMMVYFLFFFSLLYTYAVPNEAALHRFRYLPFASFLALGIFAIERWVTRLKSLVWPRWSLPRHQQSIT